jgi:hypothetical protein
MRKRYRACEACHRLKIKCDGSTAAEGGCERCLRHNLDCVPAAPRLQRDRISELEAQVEELRIALRDHSSGSNNTTPNRSPGSSLESADHGQTILSFLDAHISLSQQQHLLHLYSHQAGAAWPVIRLPVDLDQIRGKSPILLLSVLVYAITQEEQGTDLEVHDELVRETMHILGGEVIGRGQITLELVQALLIATFWNKATRRGQQGSCYQILQLATDMAIDLGIAGPGLQPSPAAYFFRFPNSISLEARRTWLACFVALANSSITTRRTNPVLWDAYHEECLLDLETRGEPPDMLFCQIARITQLIQETSDALQLCQITTFVDANHYSTHATIETLKNKVDAWAAQVPAHLASNPTLKVWKHVAMIYIYELVLHTPTNKASFAAPFIPGRIVVKDFPKPANVISPLREALEAIIFHCHVVLDTAVEMDAGLVLSLPSFCFAPTLLYSLFVLVNALVACTDPASSYGQWVAKNSFRIEECGMKLRNLTACLKLLDPTMSCYTTRLVDATGWLEEWYNDYNAILLRYEMSLIHVGW